MFHTNCLTLILLSSSATSFALVSEAWVPVLSTGLLLFVEPGFSSWPSHRSAFLVDPQSMFQNDRSFVPRLELDSQNGAVGAHISCFAYKKIDLGGGMFGVL
jgi:hypothetical protein